jgi:uncharacterized OB-fold protein
VTTANVNTAPDSIEPRRPRPAVDGLTEPFWSAARQHRLSIQQCRSCRTRHHPPVLICDDCGASDFVFGDLGQNGTIHSLTVMRRSLVPGFDRAPHMCAAVALDDDPTVLVIGAVLGEAAATAGVGDAVRTVFEDLGDGCAIPAFTVIAPDRRAT